ncbi:putative CAS1 domain-containing protein 1-like isoform X2 [Trypanosoma rangeli]|uniref:Putative CAS1 domain-containing protein 1-like isoform X2 n=1 Tax=Trypanosoma rangeli TaxID=5698 RepID=A0A422MX31_TRYRA|nr:putative CAS1 domain-containing protein 1-like isoform X2 [Trypanosoma rangeli]RNE97778.1 putative CAS1 domain-containing protein 1-like isoform X2 [Trypanosoma rangeli]|eukprot:RNE97778.1 putative CAS1 domain-containing protein 1-like isoform X2 [Trypanosoma rangeli]
MEEEGLKTADEEPCTIVSKWNCTSLKTKCMLVAILLVSLVLVWVFASLVPYFPSTFPTGPLSSGQVMAFILITFIIVWATVDTFFVRMNLLSESYINARSRIQLRGGAELSGYLLLMFVCDRTTLLPRFEKTYNVDFFWFLCIVFLGASLLTLKRAKPPSLVINGEVESPVKLFHVPPLSRSQTEEWKGWMQVLFLWYHYFHNVSIYNSIRLFIAAYVWMTGFGNFSYYYVQKDFFLERFYGMQWRLNFLVTAVCFTMGNQYMLYYICPLHTLFTLFIYVSLYLYQGMNSTGKGLCVKLVLWLVLCFFMWDVSRDLFYALWSPFAWLIGFNNPYRPEQHVLWEWFFRTSLDHYVWIYGMICAYYHPRLDSYLKRLDELPRYTSWLVKFSIAFLALLVGAMYVKTVYITPKLEYNRIHPYTSFIPITIYIVLRNLFKVARMYHIGLFEALGKVTLESYITQYHIWMATTGLNGSPKKLLRIVPEGYPCVNFALMSIMFAAVSFRLFATTNITRRFLAPPKAGSSAIRMNIFAASLFIFLVFTISYGITHIAVK